MSLIQILIVLFVAFAKSRVILRFRDKEIGYGEFFFWSGIWIIILLAVFKPNISDEIALIFGIQRGTDTMFFFATIILFYFIFRLYVKINSLDQAISQLTTNVSMDIHKIKKIRLDTKKTR